MGLTIVDAKHFVLQVGHQLEGGVGALIPRPVDLSYFARGFEAMPLRLACCQRDIRDLFSKVPRYKFGT